MNSEVRRTFEMEARAVNFSEAQPDDDAGHAVSLGGHASAYGPFASLRVTARYVAPISP
jgi:hypothetical protein